MSVMEKWTKELSKETKSSTIEELVKKILKEKKGVTTKLRPRAATGIPGFDEITQGGFIRGSTILLAGYPGAGKTTFSAQFLYNGIVEFGDAGVYVSFAETKKEFFENKEALGMNFEALEKEGKFRYVELLTVSSKQVLDNFVSQILSILDSMNAKRLVIDSITTIISLLTKPEARSFIHATFMKVCKASDITTILIADLPYESKIIGYGVEEFITDSVIVLGFESFENPVRRFLGIRKMRGVAISPQNYEFVITQGGIRVYRPLEPIFLSSIERARLSTGIPELDEMLKGGLHKCSTTLISGPSGTGKTIISMRFCLAGALKGEKTVFLSYEEPPTQLERLIEDLGYRLEEVKDNLNIISPTLQGLTPGVQHEMFRSIYNNFNPTIFVLDGTSVLERSYKQEEFLEIVRNFALLSKDKQATVAMTALHDLVKADMAELSTVADNIIALWFEREENEIKRRITVLKERGSIHDNRVKYIDFKKGKIVVYD